MLDPQSKLNVEFKPPKRMKKRRQLDALVSNGKLRRKSKNGQEHELLRSDSESSEIDEFNIATQKSYIRHRGSLASSCSTCLVVFGIFLVGGCILTCIGLIWMQFQMKQNLDNIRHRIATVEGRNQDNLENSQSVHSQIQAINKTVQSYKTGTNGLDQIVKNLSDITNKIAALNTATESIKVGLKAAPELKQIPTKLKAVSESVTSLGSDVETLKGQVEDLKKEKEVVEMKLKELEDKYKAAVDPKETSPSKESGSDFNPDFTGDILQKYDNVSKSLVKVNTTIWNRLDFLQTQLTAHKDKFALVDNITELIQKEINILKTEIPPKSTDSTSQESSKNKDQSVSANGQNLVTEEQVAVILNDLLNKMGLLNRTLDDGNKDSNTLDSLLEKVDNVTFIVTKLKEQFTKMKSETTEPKDTTSSNSSLADLLQFKANALQTFDNLQKSVDDLSGDVQNVFTALTQNKNQLVQLNHTVVYLKNYLAVLGYNNVTESSAMKPGQETPTSSMVTPISSKKTNIPSMETSVPSLEMTSQKTQSPKRSTASPTTAGSTGTIHIKGIETYDDLELGFRRWDRSGEGLVDPNDLPDYLGPNTPDPEELKKYDVNGDNLYSIEEFEAALGIKPPATLKLPVQDEDAGSL
ncbi:hypothetical protein KUTeg_015838 [Tegillarca granosa]|uniref:EF-hand calcium-binding domain-containing protein 14 n=1 Tax=Tegillarca granosa TaxID=220873 RepID=A0ABQ9EPV5_TEGGR|nr:hypothetical protein KUTeg_015838 [Tegillarca granosa]